MDAPAPPMLGGHPDAACLAAEQQASYGDVAAAVDGWTRRLRRAGVGPRSTVALQVAPSFTYVYLLLALWRTGAQVLLLDHRLKPAEAAAYVAPCRPQLRVSSGDGGGDVASRPVLVPFQAEREVSVEPCAGGAPAATDHCLVQFSSGSTGRPKVVARASRELRAELARIAALEAIPGRGDRLLLLNSLTHSFGLLCGLLHTLRAGGTVQFARTSLPSDALAALGTGATAMFATPAHYRLLASVPDPPRLPHLRTAVSSGEILPAAVAEEFARRYDLRIGQAYGMTEVGVLAADLRGRHSPAVGPLAQGVVARVRDGELEVLVERSPYLLGAPGGALREGWLRTYDRAELDDQGLLTVRGRADSLAVIGGLKVDLTEVEDVLRRHPDVDDAVVVLAGRIEARVGSARGVSAEALLHWCRERLADVKVPTRISVVAALPRTPSGKLRRDGTAATAGGPR